MVVGQWSFEKRLEETLRRTLPRLGPEARAQLEGLINPTAIAVMAGCLLAWVVSHAFGLGEAIDIILVAVGALSIGLAIFAGSTTCMTSPPASTARNRLMTWIERPTTWRRRSASWEYRPFWRCSSGERRPLAPEPAVG
jgi:hypothetical protein